MIILDEEVKEIKEFPTYSQAMNFRTTSRYTNLIHLKLDYQGLNEL